MSARYAIVISAVLLLVSACGGGGDGGVVGGGGSTPSLQASFVPDNPNPTSNDVAMLAGTSADDRVQIRVTLTDVNDVFGAAFDVTYDATAVQLDRWLPGNLLEQSGASPLYFVETPVPGRTVVSAQLLGASSGVNASGTQTLIVLVFRVLRTGSFALGFEAASVSDSQFPPQPIVGLRWSAGTLLGT